MVEYLLRVVVADRKVAFILSMHGLIDLAAILPFDIALGVDLRSIRAVRLLRFLRILKLARYTRAIDRFRRAVAIAREELWVVLACSYTRQPSASIILKMKHSRKYSYLSSIASGGQS